MFKRSQSIKDQIIEFMNGNQNFEASWTKIDYFGQMRFSKTSYLYLVGIPIIVKATEKIESPINFFFGESLIPISIELPFSWFIFYIAAISISIGALIYQIYCPEIIKNYSNYGEFLDAKQSDEVLMEYKIRYIPFSNTSTRIIDLPYVEVESNPPETEQEEILRSWRKSGHIRNIIAIQHNIKYEEKRKDIFNKIYAEINLTKKRTRKLALFAYYSGFCLFLLIIIQNFYFVVARFV